MTRKDQVKAAFSQAASTYDSAARAQKLAADHLGMLVSALPRPARPRVLEFGCGTGLLTRRLYPIIGGDWLVTDLSPSMLEAAKPHAGSARFALMDAEAPDLGDERFDLIVSNMAAQWFADLGQAVRRLAGLRAPGGHLAFSTLGAQSFGQWRQAHDDLGLACGVPAFPTRQAVQAMLPADARISEQVFDLDYVDGRAFGAELKLIGAGIPAVGHQPLNAKDMRRVLHHLGRPVRMSYHLLHVSMTRK